MTTDLELIDTIFFSEKRKNLLLFLKSGPKNIEEIKSGLRVSSSPIMAQIRILLKEGLLLQQGDLYELSVKGKLIVPKMKALLETFKVFDENSEYWARQNLKTIPPHLFERIGELGSCREVVPDRTRIFDYPSEIIENLYKSETVLEVSSIFRPGYPDLYIDLAKRGIEVSVVLDRPIFDKLVLEFRTDVEEFLALDKTSLFACDPAIELASCLVTDRFTSFSLPSKDGRYYNHEMLSFEKSAFFWGQELFCYYRDLAEQVLPEHF